MILFSCIIILDLPKFFLCYNLNVNFCRLGFLIDFLSHAAIVGFMAGAAITIALQQLKGFLGIKAFTKKTDIVSVLRSVFNEAHHGVRFHFCLETHFEMGIIFICFNLGLQWNWETIVIGVAFLVFLLITKYIVRMPTTTFLLFCPFPWNFHYHNFFLL